MFESNGNSYSKKGSLKNSSHQGLINNLNNNDTEPSLNVFGLKDIFTCINILGGVFAIIFCIHNNIRYAALSFLLGYLLGDALDGLVARLTNTGNSFGREFDTISDHLSQCIAPGMIIFVAYQSISIYLATILTSTFIISGSIRHARNSVSPVNFPEAYLGLPRTASSFIIISFLNSYLFTQLSLGAIFGIPMIVMLSIAHIIPLPFRTHRGRKLIPLAKIFVFSFFLTTLLALFFATSYVFDVTFVWLSAYMMGSWIELTPEERKAFFIRAREWQKELRRAR